MRQFRITASQAQLIDEMLTQSSDAQRAFTRVIDLVARELDIPYEYRQAGITVDTDNLTLVANAMPDEPVEEVDEVDEEVELK